MPEHGGTPEPGNDRLELLQAFASEISRVGGQSRDVPAGAGQAPNNSELDWVDDAHKNSGHRRGRSLDGQRRRRSRSHDDIDFRAHQLFGKLRELIETAVSGSELDDHILALHISSLTQALPQAADVGLGRMAPTEEPGPGAGSHLLCLIRLRAGRSAESGQRDAAAPGETATRYHRASAGAQERIASRGNNGGGKEREAAEARGPRAY